MSDISLPPESPNELKKEHKGMRAIAMFIALVSPMPLLICASDLWLTLTKNGQEPQPTAFALIRQMMDGSGDPPIWLMPLSIVPALVVLMILGRTAASRAVAILMLFFFAAGEIMLAAQVGESFIR